VKHCRRKFSVSSTSIPDGGSGLVSEFEGGRLCWWRGFSRVVIACTLESVSCWERGEEGNVPVKCTSEDEVVVYGELVETFCEVALVY
jgi:hypothetical protein